MKKTTSILIAFVILLSAITPFSAYAKTKSLKLACTECYSMGYFVEPEIVSSNPSVATVINDGDYYYIKGVSVGTAKITAKENYVDTTDIYNVTVVKPTLTCAVKNVTADIDDYCYDDAYYEWVGEKALITVTYTGFNGLTVKSSNTTVATVGMHAKELSEYIIDSNMNTYAVAVKMKKKGKTTVTVSDNYGNKVSVNLTVTDKEGDADAQDALVDGTSSKYCYYGDTVIKGNTLSNTNVTLYYGGKTYTRKADGNGNFYFGSLPVKKIGTKYQLIFKKDSASAQITDKIRSYEPFCEHKHLFYNQSTFKGLVKDVHKGDVIIVKIGKKTYKKKVKKNKKKFKYSIKIKKAKYGTKIKITVKNKYKQKLTSYSDTVYYSKKLKKGMTMAQAKCVPGWVNPDEKSYYDNGTYWWYDDDNDGYASDSYLYFNSRGRLEAWHFTA